MKPFTRNTKIMFSPKNGGKDAVMKKELNIMIDGELKRKFEMALSLNGEEKSEVIEMLLKSYVSRAFAQAAVLYENESKPVMEKSGYYGKALNKIPKWANKPQQAIYKIIRAFFQLEKEGAVTYTSLASRCADYVNHSDVYVVSFATVFAQMKFDGEKSYGKIFEVKEDGTVEIWEHVKPQLVKYKKEFTVRSTDYGYINDFRQKNLGKTDEKGSDFGQYLYLMHCNDCGYEYKANGTDIFQKKCPKCQGGVDTGAFVK